MHIDRIIDEIVLTVAALPKLGGVGVLAVNKGDVSKELEIKIAKCGLCVVVGWNGFTPAKQGRGDEVYGDVTIVATVFEKPAVNRLRTKALTCLTVAQTIARELQATACEGMNAPLYLRRIAPLLELKPGEICCDVEFSTKAAL